MAVPVCHACGEPLPRSARFCGRCGARRRSSEGAPAGPADARGSGARLRLVAAAGLVVAVVVALVAFAGSSGDPGGRVDDAIELPSPAATPPVDLQETASTATDCSQALPGDVLTGGLTTWRGDRVQLALPEVVMDEGLQLWVQIPGAGRTSSTFTISATPADGAGNAEFALFGGRGLTPWHDALFVFGRPRTSALFPAHWTVAGQFSHSGCWIVRIETETFVDRVLLPVPSVRGDQDVQPAGEPAAPPVAGFVGRTDTVLLFDDGEESAYAVDLDTGRHATIPLPGQREGDQPFRLWRVGGQVLVGWGEIHLDRPDGRHSRTVGEATFFVPAADPTRVWLLDTAGTTSSGPTWTLAEVTGRVVHATEGRADLAPLRGVPGGLLLIDDEARLLVYDPDTDAITPFADGTAGWVGNVVGDRVVWCGPRCTTLHLETSAGTSVGESARTTRIRTASGERFQHDAIWLAGDRPYLAAVVQPTLGHGARELRVYDTGTGDVLAVVPLGTGTVWASWTPDDTQLFYWVRSPAPPAEGPAPAVGRWQAGSDRFELQHVEALRGVDVGATVAFPTEALTAVFG